MTIDRTIGLIGLALSIAALVPFFFEGATGNLSRRRVLSAMLIGLLLLFAIYGFWQSRIDDEKAGAEESARQQAIASVERDVLMQLKKSPLTWDQIFGTVNAYSFDDVNAAIDDLKNEGKIDSDMTRVTDEAHHTFEVKVWHIRSEQTAP